MIDTNICRSRRDRKVVGFTATYAFSAYHHWICELNPAQGEVYSIH